MDKALLIAVNTGSKENELNEEIIELENLCAACEIEVINTVIQNLNKVNPDTYLGKGKVEEIKLIADSEECNLIVVNDELSPLQVSNLEKALDIEVYDRTYVILEIFRRRAHTREAKLQVELATKKYLLPRLIGSRSHLSRQRGSGMGFSHGRGSGEMKLELDRRKVFDQISEINTELLELKNLRQTQRKQRKRQGMKVISLVGYTNSGKSSTLNALLSHSIAAKKEVFEKDMLFATLETSTRLIKTESNLTFLLTDTVGFVNKLPHQLIEAFKSTLEEITESDLVLHIVDCSNENFEKQISVTNQVLTELGVKDIPMIYVFNKTDLNESFFIPPLYEKTIKISAKNSLNLEGLLIMIEEELFKDYRNLYLKLPFSKADLYNRVKENAIVEAETIEEDGYLLKAKMSNYLYGFVQEYEIFKDRIK
jgi:GTP-binding protein HflX